MFRLLSLTFRIFYLAWVKLTRDDDAFLDAVIDFVKTYGGLYVKFTQLLAMQTTLFKKAQSAKLLAFYDNVGYHDIDVLKFLQKEMKPEAYIQVASIEDTPFASGAFAQVYKGTLKNGEKVIFKVKKKGLRGKLTVDLFLLRIFVYALDSVYKIPLFNPIDLYNEFKRNILRELDYKTEVENALTMAGYYKDHPQVYIPKTYPELSSSNLIVQEFVAGVSMTALIRARNTDINEFNRIVEDLQIDVREFVKTLLYELSSQSGRYEKFFGDPHPGNIILMGGINYAFIDFGVLDDIKFNKGNYYKIMQFIMNMNRESNVGELAEEMLMFGAAELYEALATIDRSLLSSKDKQSFLETVSSSYTDLISKKYMDFLMIKGKDHGFSEIFFELVKMGNKFNLSVPTMLFNIARSSSICASYVNHLMPGEYFMNDIYNRMLEEFSDMKNEHTGLSTTDVELEAAIHFVIEWITGIAEKDATLFTKIINLVKNNSNYV